MNRRADPLRVAVWGLGRHAINKILPAASAAEGLLLYGVCSRNPETVTDCSRRWDCRGWTEPTAMLGDRQVDIVYVATPIGLHAKHGRAVLAAHKHLWCEKPLTAVLRDTLDLLETSRRLGLAVCEGHMYLHHPQFSRLSKYLSDGRVGRVLSVWCRFGIPQLAHPGFRSDPILGVDSLLDVGCYPISAIQALFPHDANTIKYARVSSRDGATVHTDGYCVIEFSGGAQATLEWRINAAYRNEIEIWGEKGSLFTDKLFSKPATHRPSFLLRDSQGVETVEYAEPEDHFVRMLEAFRRMVGDSTAMESERGDIARRAALVERIWSASSSRMAERV